MKRWMIAAGFLGLACMHSAQAAVVFFTNFDGSIPAELSGTTSTTPVVGFAGLGNGGNTFATNMLFNNTTGNPASLSTLTLTGLAPHTTISIGFLLAVIDSWDSTNGSPSPDLFNVRVDGNTVFQPTFNNTSGTVNYSAPVNGDIGGGKQARGFSGFLDQAFDMYLESSLQNIAHSSSSVTIDFFASGAGWQGGADESWGMDNLQVSTNATSSIPEPGTLLLLGSAICALATARKLRK